MPDNIQLDCTTTTQDSVQSAAAAGALPAVPGATAAALANDGEHASEPVEALLVAKEGELVLAATATGRYHVWHRAAGAP